MRFPFVTIWICNYMYGYCLVLGYETNKGQVLVSEEEQKSGIDHKLVECFNLMQLDLHLPPPAVSQCPRTWDGMMCWPPTLGGTLASQPCPDYVHGFYTTGHSTKQCLDTGQWYYSPEFNNTWTNYTNCIRSPSPSHIPNTLKVHVANIKMMYNIGYGLSLTSLILAVFILLYFKKLRCPRNTVHINLFVSFILRAVICFLKDLLVVEGLGFSFDLERTPLDTILFIEDGMHWECKLLYTMFHYLLSANYMWVLVEGLYLHTLVNVSVFSERSSVRWYLLLGWGTPLLSIIPWVIVRATVEDALCWNTNPTFGFFMILQTPIILSLVINFIFFINILRALFTKLHLPNASTARRCRYRRLAKATLILIPLFGVHFIVFIFLPENVNSTAEIVKLYFEMFFNSFQGFFVAVLFCFLNQEVQMEIRKKWYRIFSKTDPRVIQQSQYLAVSVNGSRRPTRANSCRTNSIPNRAGDAPTTSESSSENQGCLCKWTLDKNGRLKRTFINTASKVSKNCGSYAIETKM